MIGRFFSRRDDRKFGEDLQSNLIRLFSEHSARVVSNDDSEYRGKRSFDYAVATVSTPDLDLRFVRVRGQFEVYISIPNMRRWDSLDSALLWLDMQRGIRGKTDLPSWGYFTDWRTLNWESIDQFLVENWDRLKAAASERGF